MRNVRRRTVLTAAGVTGLAVAFPAPQIAFAENPRGDAAIDESSLLDNIVGRVAGTNETNASDAVQPKLIDLYERAKENLEDLIVEPSTELFPGIALGTDEDNLSATFKKLYEIAVATAMPVPTGASVPADLSGNSEAKQQVISGLRWVYDHHFQDQESGYYGNWFNWEIGNPTHISQTLALLRDDLESSDPELAQLYVDSMDLYLRNGKDGGVDLDSRFHTGANLVDITTNRIVQGAAVDDTLRITTAISDQLTAYQLIDLSCVKDFRQLVVVSVVRRLRGSRWAWCGRPRRRRGRGSRSWSAAWSGCRTPRCNQQSRILFALAF